MADIDYDKMSDAFSRAMRRSSGGNAWSSPSSAADSLNSLKNSITPTEGAFNAMKNQIQNSIGAWRELSKVGASFSNDLVGMTLSAKEARMSLEDFADVVGQSASALAGLGGSVTRGAEAFAKLAKDFQDSEFSRELMNLGYTTKEVNETLALNLGFQKSTAKMDEASRKKSMDSAYGLAVEMDLLAKMTGQSRVEQARQLRDAQRDASVESKFRLIGAKEGPAAEAKARAAFAKEYAAAEAKGMGQLYKDIFTKGVPASEEAATQMALYGKAAKETAESAKLLGKGLDAEAAKATERADVANLQNQKNTTLLTIGAMGELAGGAGKAAQTMVSANDTLYHSAKALADANGIVLKSQQDYAKALDLLKADVIASSKGMRKKEGEKDYEKVSGAAEGIIATEKAVKDSQAGIASSMRAADESGKSIASTLNTVGSELANAAKGLGDIRARMAEEAQKGVNAAYAKEKGQPGVGGQAVQAAKTVTEGSAAFGSDVVQEIGNFFAPANKPVPETNQKPEKTQATSAQPEPPKRSLGTLGATGNLFEDFGEKKLVELHGIEGVMKPGQLQEIVEKTANSAIKGASSVKSAALPSINLDNVSRDIKTTFSSVKVATSGGDEKTTRQVMSDKAKAAESELEKLTDAFGEQRRKVAEQVNAQLKSEGKESLPFKEKNKIVADQIKEARAQYEEEAAKLRKVIEDGTTTEVTYKKAAVEESKKVSAEERIAKFNDLQAASEQIKENSKLTQQSIKEKKTASQEMSKAQEAELKEAQKQAALSKDLIGKNVAGMSDDAISDMIKKSGAKFENFYIDTTKAGESILKSFSADYVEANKRSKGPSVGDALKESTAGIPKSIVNAEEQTRIKQAKADAALKESLKPDGNIYTSQEEHLKRSFEVDAEKERVQTTGVIDPKFIERSMQLGKINLNDSQKKIYDEMMSMSSSAAKQRLESLKAESEAAFNTNRAAADAMQTMEKSYEQEGRLAELEHNEEYKRLSEQLSASSNLSKVKNSELTAAKQAADTQATIAIITGKNTEDLKNTQIEAAKEVQKNAELTNTALINAVPTKELTLSTEELTAKLTQGQKNYFNYLLKQDDETIKYKEESTKQQLTLDIEKLKEADDKIESVKAEIQNASTANQKKQLEFKLEGYKQEKTALEESKKYHEEDLETINKAIEAKKKDIDATTQIVEATSEKIEQAKLDVQAVTDVNNKTKQETAVTAKESSANKNRILDSEKLRTTAVNKEGKVDLNSLRLPGMKGFGSELKAIPKEPPAAAADTKGALNKVAEDKAKVEKEKEAARAAEAAKVKTTSTATVTPTTENAAAPKKSATLDDVVGSLNRLNTQMSQLITQQSDLLNKQIKTTRTSGSSNIYDRVTP